MGWPTLTTDRLVLRPLAANDLDDLAALHAEESFWRYPFGRAWSRSETESFLERTIERYRDPGIAVSAPGPSCGGSASRSNAQPRIPLMGCAST